MSDTLNDDAYPVVRYDGIFVNPRIPIPIYENTKTKFLFCFRHDIRHDEKQQPVFGPRGGTKGRRHHHPAEAKRTCTRLQYVQDSTATPRQGKCPHFEKWQDSEFHSTLKCWKFKVDTHLKVFLQTTNWSMTTKVYNMQHTNFHVVQHSAESANGFNNKCALEAMLAAS